MLDCNSWNADGWDHGSAGSKWFWVDLAAAERVRSQLQHEVERSGRLSKLDMSMYLARSIRKACEQNKRLCSWCSDDKAFGLQPHQPQHCLGCKPPSSPIHQSHWHWETEGWWSHLVRDERPCLVSRKPSTAGRVRDVYSPADLTKMVGSVTHRANSGLTQSKTTDAFITVALTTQTGRPTRIVVPTGSGGLRTLGTSAVCSSSGHVMIGAWRTGADVSGIMSAYDGGSFADVVS